jgi:hypothetical protein
VKSGEIRCHQRVVLATALASFEEVEKLEEVA